MERLTVSNCILHIRTVDCEGVLEYSRAVVGMLILIIAHPFESKCGCC